MLGLLAQTMFEATRVAPLANSATGTDWRTSSIPDRSTDLEKNGERLCMPSTSTASKPEPAGSKLSLIHI